MAVAIGNFTPEVRALSLNGHRLSSVEICVRIILTQVWAKGTQGIHTAFCLQRKI
jgi:hypothetical protein